MRSRIAIGFVALLATISGCDRQASEDNSLLSREQAVEIAEQTIKDRGIARSNYSLSTYGEELSEDEREWLFNYELKPVPCPGCFFLIVVDRATGKATFVPGE